ncbi:uncharacterized protein DUF4396 [Thioclava sp. ES.031]|uniref:DUF4396 domain-containing protein n=1 Tax=Thioclava sp. ES.031 TaxID=1798203 RepID=UPI000BF7B756|nr:DUF4396 domain-containing protein [Thioclava sp. ES.031]PFG64507.1 uncharacterized protein DUF4396 [Thioclava sp. ES.031]
MTPNWFTVLSWLSLAVGVLSFLYLLVQMRRNPPHMAIMAWVWPICGLFGGPLVIWLHGRFPGHGNAPFPVSVAKGTLHCGAGCTLGDILAENLALAVPAVLIAFGWPGFWEDKIFAVWGLDYVFALAIGIVFQYFSIAPMRGLGLVKGLKEAAKADVASLTSWQVGMYGMMAIFQFAVFKGLWGAEINAADPEFWFAMQIAMMAGFVTAYPVNWLLIRKGIKEEM